LAKSAFDAEIAQKAPTNPSYKNRFERIYFEHFASPVATSSGESDQGSFQNKNIDNFLEIWYYNL
jgi:hypothetical protein